MSLHILYAKSNIAENTVYSASPIFLFGKLGQTPWPTFDQIVTGHQTSARVSLLRVEIENETSQENFLELRMRVLGESFQ